MLDIVLSSQKEFFDNVKIWEPLGCSDHNQIHFIIKVKAERNRKIRYRKHFHKGRYKDMREYLAKIDWNNTLKNKTATECWNILEWNWLRRWQICPLEKTDSVGCISTTTRSSVHYTYRYTSDMGILIDKLKILMSRLGSALYSGHSFRIGAATTAAAANIPDHLIRTLGSWTSDCYCRYIRTSHASLQRAQQAMYGPLE